MLISCPYCGPRDLIEFSYQGDANRTRPDRVSMDVPAWNTYIYDRVNTAGDHAEFWQHSGGCRMYMRVVRSTLTHAITSVEPARAHASSARRAKRTAR